MNWTGHVLVAPRSRLAEALQRGEATRTGVYFLVGDDPEQPTKSRVYVGEGDIVAERIKSHAKDEHKEFWTRACLVTSKDLNLTKAHVRYLESRFVELTKNSERANVANGNEPAPKSLPESDVADMEFFISQVHVILPVVGFDFLRGRAKAVTSSDVAAQSPLVVSASKLDLVLTSEKYDFEARAVEIDGEITVLAGSYASTKSFMTNNYASLRNQLVQDGRLVPAENPKFLRFAEDVAFASSSAAAAVIKNRNTNGRTSWKLVATGQTLKDWQDAQLSSVPDHE